MERAPRLADLVDLELVLRRDRERPLEQLRERERRVAGDVGAGPEGGPRGRELVLAWLGRVRVLEDVDAGARTERGLQGVGLALGVTGLVVGFASVAGWLSVVQSQPVNVIHFWVALVGVQAALLALWLPNLLPAAWIERVPLLRGARGLLGALVSGLPALAGTALSRLTGRELDTSSLRRLDALYGELRFWWTARLSQGFALAFNLGAVAALAGIPYVDDPAFGWRSRLLDPPELHAIIEIVGAPWCQPFASACPDEVAVEATRYSRMDPRFGDGSWRGERPGRWAVWWPFLLASLLCYGVAPRLLLWGWARLRSAALLRAVTLDHADVERVRARLLRPSVEGRALSADADTLPASRYPGDAPLLPSGACDVLCWSGVDLELDAVSERLEALGVHARSVARVGAADDVGGDRVALAGLRERETPAPVVLIVEGWEPPAGDYLDFIAALRDVIGPGLPLVVALQHPSGFVDPRLLQQWRTRLAQLADPQLRIEALTGRTS